VTDAPVRPSLIELASACTGAAIVFGHGGGGDAVQAVTIARLLNQLGIREVYVGGVASSWWGEEGKPITDSTASVVFGPTAYPVTDLTDCELVAPHLALVTPASRYKGNQPVETIIAERHPWPTFIVDVTGGVRGMVTSLNAFIRERNVGLFVSLDCGADSLHSGTESKSPHTPFVDCMSTAMLLGLDCPTVFGMVGFGCDGELPEEDVERNIGTIMRAGGFLGAYGLTQADVRDIGALCAAFPDPIEVWVVRAARGEFGLHTVPINAPWGQSIHVTPWSPVILFFDPHVMVDALVRGARALESTESLAAAEDAFAATYGIIPETRYVPVLRFTRD
jgi:hypothetical protein